MPEPYTPPGSKVTYTVPLPNEPADGPLAFKNFADSVPMELSPVIPINRQSADYTLVAEDEGCIVSMVTTDGDLKVTLPKTGPAFDVPVGAAIAIANTGMTRKRIVQIVAEQGVFLRDLAVRKIGLWRIVVLVQVEKDSWIITAGQGNDDIITFPSEPLNMDATVTPERFITVTWEKPEDDGGSPILQYIVETSTAEQGYLSRAVADGVATSAVMTGLLRGLITKIQVRAVNKLGASGPSNVVEVTVPL